MSQITARLIELRVATVFLTRLAIGNGVPEHAWTLNRAAWAFPLVGIGIGAFGGAVFWAGSLLNLPDLMGALLALGAMIWLTGALHEDGFADLADSFGGRGRDKKLSIMKDSRIGSYGALALIVSVGLRASALASLEGATGFPALIATEGAARIVPVWIMALGTPVGDGLAKMAGRPAAPVLAAATAIGLLAAATLPIWAFPALIAAIGVSGLLVFRTAHTQLGGYTGDVLGASVQAAQIVGLIVITLFAENNL